MHKLKHSSAHHHSNHIFVFTRKKSHFRAQYVNSEFRCYQQGKLKQHLELHSDERQTFPCTSCPKSFSRPNTLRHHSSECKKTFSKKRLLKIHQRTHTGEKPFSCAHCGKCFRQAQHKHSHERIHTGEKPYSCTTCEKAYHESSALRSHIITHEQIKLHKCEPCDLSFLRLISLNGHNLTHHEIEKNIACPQCDKKYKRNKLT